MRGNPRMPEGLWEDMENHARSSNNPWLVAGDLNETLFREESRSFSADSSAGQRRKFAAHINNSNLIDLGSAGPKFTWNNGRQGMANIQKRLDRALCNEEWNALFPEGMVLWSKPSLGLIPIMLLFLFVSLVTPFPVELIGLFGWRQNGLLILLLRMS